MAEEPMEPTGDPAGPEGGTGGEGGTSTDYAGFETPDALVEDYQARVSQLESLQGQITDLERIKGTQGNELGTLRNQVAQLTGQIEGMRTAAPAEPQGPTLDDIARQLEDGDLTEGEAIRKAAQVASQQTKTELGQQFKKDMATEIGNLKAELNRDKYVSNFLKQNPGYEEAYNSGKLNPWLSQGISGEEAWLHYQVQAKDTELAALKKQAEGAAAEAEKGGIDKGIQIQKGKTAAGKVLTGKGGQFAQSGEVNLDPSAPDFALKRRQAGIDKLNQLRSGG